MLRFLEIENLLSHFGIEVPEETYRRYYELLSNLTRNNVELDDIVKGIFPYEGIGELIVETEIPIFSFCEHHILPWFGTVDIAYICDGRIIGFSKFEKVVRYFSSGLTLQETVCDDILNFFKTFISKSSAVKIEAVHTCKIRNSGTASKTITVRSSGSLSPLRAITLFTKK